jgi:hypothetical protein
MILSQFKAIILLIISSISWNAKIGLVMALASSSSSSSPAASAPRGDDSSTPTQQSRGTATCAVVGVGVLGTSLCRQLVEEGGVEVTGFTKTSNRHEQILSSVPRSPRFKLAVMPSGGGLQADAPVKYDSVVFCAPPSGFEDYAEAVEEAVDQLWNRIGVFAFTSSGAV